MEEAERYVREVSYEEWASCLRAMIEGVRRKNRKIVEMIERLESAEDNRFARLALESLYEELVSNNLVILQNEMALELVSERPEEYLLGVDDTGTPVYRFVGRRRERDWQREGFV